MTNSNIPRIEFRGVSKVYYTRNKTIEAVKDYSMTVDAGDFVSIIGPSGCGKSTLIRMLDGIIQPSAGDILIDGNYLNTQEKFDRETLRRMGFIFQQPNLLPWFTIRQNVSLPLKIFGLKGQEHEEYVDQLMAIGGLTGQADSYPIEVSGGTLQRAGVIRAMVHKPQILLMDEPFGALDAQTRTIMQEILMKAWEKSYKTILFVTHDVEEAIFLADTVYVMTARPGRLKEVIPINLPRPRDYSIKSTPEFLKIKGELLGLIREETLRAIR